MADAPPERPPAGRDAENPPPPGPTPGKETARRQNPAPAATPKPAAPPPAPGKGTVRRENPAPPKTTVRREVPTGEAAPPAPLSRTPIPVAETVNEAADRARRLEAMPPLKGVGLQLKIMLTMGLTSLLGAAGIAAAVYSRASLAFEEQINERGERLVDILASVPPDVWLTAIHGGNRGVVFEELIQKLDPVDDFMRKPEFKQLRNLLTDPFSPDWQGEIDRLFGAVIKDPGWRDRVERSPELKSRYDQLVRPMSAFSKLLPFRDLERGGDLHNVGVFDVSRGETNPPGILPIGRATLENLPKPRGSELTTKVDQSLIEKEGRTNLRMFIRNPDPDDPVKLRYLVSLSLRKIEEAKRSLLQMILLPTLIALGASLAIAAFIANRITKPLRVLIGDINQVSSGDLNHQTSARSGDEIGRLASTFNRMTSALRQAQQQELTTRALEHELGIASEIQTNLIPKTILKVPGYDLGAYYKPSKEVGGDYYDFIEIDEIRSGLIVADVSGKGVPGSLVMAMARAFIRMEAERSRNPSTADTLARANRMLARDMRKGMFVTAIYGILDRTNHQIRVSSAGHNPMLLWRARTAEIVLVNPKGIALGLDKGPVFERTISEEIIQLEPGDRVVLYTDGVVEAMNPKREEFGDRRFQELVKKLAKTESNQFLNVVLKALAEHQGSAPQHDDMTIVTLRRV